MVSIRPAVLDDVAQIADVHVRGWQVGYRGLLPSSFLDGLTAAQRIPRWTAWVQQAAWPGRGTLVADRDGQVVGFASIGPTADADQDPAQVGEIASLYVHPTAWGHGIGRALTTAALSRLTDAGRTTATLWVLSTNARGIAFYTATGWSADGAVKPDVAGGVPIQDLRYRRACAADRRTGSAR